jgi:hypothetical protein
MNFKTWAQQPTTIHGMMAIVGTLIAAGGAYVQGSHATAMVGAAAGLAAGVVGLVMPDNSVASADTRDAVAKFVTDIEGKSQQQAIADAFAGVVKVLSDIQVKLPAANANTAAPASSAGTQPGNG